MRSCGERSLNARRHRLLEPPPRENQRSVFRAQNIPRATAPKAFPVLVWEIRSTSNIRFAVVESCQLPAGETRFTCGKVEPAFRVGVAAAVLSGKFPFCSGSRVGCVSVNVRAAVYDRRIIPILRNGASGLAATIFNQDTKKPGNCGGTSSVSSTTSPVNLVPRMCSNSFGLFCRALSVNSLPWPRF